MEHLYFFEYGCTWCSKITPVIDKLLSENYKIAKLDLAEEENSRLYDLLKTKYKVNCGTPLLINKNNGTSLCGAAPEEAIRKWLDNKIDKQNPNLLAERLNRIESKIDYVINYLHENGKDTNS